jgi:hypothetical protein
MLQIGGISSLGLSLADVFRARADQAPPKARPSYGRTKTLIMLYLHGGHAQQETWDPKPDAPEGPRGQFGAISTSVPGVQISELLPLSAKLMHKLAVIRSMSHDNANHVQASMPAMTGHAHPPGTESRGDFPPSPTDFPPFGAVLDALRPAKKLPTWVQVGPLMRRNNGTVLHGQLPGFLGTKHSPFTVNQDLLPESVKIGAVARQPELTLARLDARRSLLKDIDAQRQLLDRAADVGSFDEFQARALDLLSSSAAAKAFNLSAEPDEMRDRYGRNQFGQCCLLARRLAEAGVPIVNVHFCHTPVGSWDTHSKHFPQMKESLCPTLDRAFAALVGDLDERGLLTQTLVIPNAEFGRTPKVNSAGGRDHWPWVYSISMAGGGTAEGVVYGTSDRLAAYPTSNAHGPEDVAATIYHLLGIPAETIIYDPIDRPHHLVIGERIDALLG